MISLVEYQPIEYIPDFDGLVEVWITLFGSSESASVSKLCRQYWDYNWRQSAARRAIIDVARSRFPVHVRPLVRLLRAMTGSGSMGFSEADELPKHESVDTDRRQCSSYVFHYFRTLPTYTQVLDVASRTGANVLFDRIVEQRGPSSSGGMVYVNTRPIRIPGGSVLPVRTVGRLLTADSSTESVIVAWQFQHSGWKVLLDVLIQFLRSRRGLYFGRNHADVDASRRGDQPVTISLEDIGFEASDNPETVICDILELIASVIQENPVQTAALMDALENGETNAPLLEGESSSLDLVQIVVSILEDSLTRYGTSQDSPVAPAISILAALLSLPDYSNRVWLHVRSSSALFGPDGASLFVSTVLEVERRIGQYAVTLALLHLVRKLLEEGIGSSLTVSNEQPKMHYFKDEVLLRALRLVHTEIWVEYTGWRYARLSDRFVVGKCIIDIFDRILETSSALARADTFKESINFVSSTLLSKATPPSINPLVYGMATGANILLMLKSLRRYAEMQQLGLFLNSCLVLIRTILHSKMSQKSSSICLLEQTLCTEITVGKTRANAGTTKANPVDVLANYVRERSLGQQISLSALRALTTLCLSLSTCTPSYSIIGHL